MLGNSEAFPITNGSRPEDAVEKQKKTGSSFRKLSNIEQRSDNWTGILISLELGALATGPMIASVALTLFEGSIMEEPQSLSSIIPLTPIERPACPKCQAQMMLARIMPAFLGTDLHTFECTVCNHVMKTLGAYDDPMQSGERGRRL